MDGETYFGDDDVDVETLKQVYTGDAGVQLLNRADVCSWLGCESES